MQPDDARDEGTEKGPEDPTRFGEEPAIEPLDEAPDGRTPGDHNEPTPESLPPGSERQSDEGGDSDTTS